MTRTRTRNSFGTFPTRITSYEFGYDWSSHSYRFKPREVAEASPWTIPVMEETMVDTPDGDRKGIHSCVHTKMQRSYAEPGLFTTDGWSWELQHPSMVIDTRLAASFDDYPTSFGSKLTADVLRKIQRSNPVGLCEDTLPFLKDLRQTVEMIRNPLNFCKWFVNQNFGYSKSARKCLKRLSKKDPFIRHLAAAGMTGAANGWLEYQFGWLPLLSDIKATCEAMGSMSDRYALYKAEGSKPKRRRFMASETSTRSFTPSHVPYLDTWKRSDTTHKARCIFDVTLKPAPPTVSYCEFISRSFGLMPDQWPGAIWEMIPYSFVVDWFIPVGDKIREIASTPVKFDILSQQYDISSDSTVVYTHADRTPANETYGRPSLDNVPVCTDRCVKYTRSTLPIVLNDKPWINNTQALDLLALIVQALKLPIHRK